MSTDEEKGWLYFLLLNHMFDCSELACICDNTVYYETAEEFVDHQMEKVRDEYWARAKAALADPNMDGWFDDD